MAWRNQILSHDRYSSNAEQTILQHLHRWHLEPLTKTTILFEDGSDLDRCMPDYFYPQERLAVFVDGPPHDSESKRSRDEIITRKLSEKGYRVLRLRYPRSKLSKAMANQFSEDIRRTVQGLQRHDLEAHPP